MSRGSRTLTRIAVLALALFLSGLSGFTIWVGQSTQRAGENVRVTALDALRYQNAESALAAEEAAEVRLAFGGGAGDLRAFDAGASALVRALSGLSAIADDRDRGVAKTVMAWQRRYVTWTETLARDLRAGRVQGAAGARIASAQATMSGLLSRAATSESRAASSSFGSLRWQTLTVRVGSIALFLVGIVLLALVWFVLRFYRRRVEGALEVERAQLQQAALTDAVTGLGNHRVFQESLRREFSRSQRHRQVLSLALVDLDEFKLINDQHGHSHGDRVLRRLADCFAEHRLEDQPFRLGGDEFAVILPAVDAHGARASMDRLRAYAERELFGATISIGIAQIHPSRHMTDADPENLREMADAALYEAKRRGRNAVVSFEDIKSTATIVSTRHINAVRRLLAEQEFTIAFQPIWDMKRRVLLAYEALMRPAERYELSGPQEVFDIAERLGRGSELDEICRDRILKHAPPLPRGVLLFLNVSPASLDHSRFGDSALLRAVNAAGLQPGQIVFEITERAVARVDMVVREAKRLRAAGFRLALDDVGAGNTGLEVLRQVPFDFVKIDKSIVGGAMEDAGAAAVLAGVVAFARQSNTFVIAEGIETPAMLSMVERYMRPTPESDHAIRGVQGYMLGKPRELPLSPDKPKVAPQRAAGAQPRSLAG